MTDQSDTNDAKEYLETGGLGEVIGLTLMAQEMGEKKVQMDTDMALALCELAQVGLAGVVQSRRQQ